MARSGVIVLAATVGYLAAAGVGNAQETATESYFKVWSSDRQQVNLRKQAACIARKYPEDARAVVVDDINMREILARMPRLSKPCGDGALFKDNTFSISQPMYEFVLAEALIARLPPGTSLASVPDAPPLSRQKMPATDPGDLPRDYRDAFSISRAMLQLDAAAECAVRRDPQEAAVLVASRPNSDAEHMSLRRLDAGLRACDPMPVGAPDFVRRGAIAYNLFRLFDAGQRRNDRKDGPHA